MKKITLILSLMFVYVQIYAQVTTDDNTTLNPTTDYVGWDNGITNALRIKHEGNYGIEFYTNTGAGAFGTPKMTLTSTGKLGIGNTSPTSWLDIVSTSTKETFRTDVPANEDNYWRMFAQGNEYGRLYHLYGTGSATGFYMVAPRGNLRFGSGYGTGTVIPAIEITGTSGTSGGNVLIGDYSATSASSRLHIKGNGYTSLFKAENSTQTTPAFEVLETEQILGNVRNYSGSATVGAFDFGFIPASSITNGIGLNLSATASSSGLFIGSKINVSNSYNGFTSGQYGLYVKSSSTNTSLFENRAIFAETDATTGVNFAGYFKSYSVVGTGGSNTGVYAEAAFSETTIGSYGYAVGGNAAYSLLAIGFKGEAIGSLSTIGVYGVGSDDANGEVFGVKGEAFDVDINTANASYGVWGKADIQTCTTTGTPPVTTCAGAAGYFDGDVFASGNTYQNSDATIKDQIGMIQNALGILDQITPKQFTYNLAVHPRLNLPTGQHFGFIAQEIEPVLPELVKDFNNPRVTDSLGQTVAPAFSIKAVNYVEFIPILVAAIKEQKNIIDSLINALQNPTPIVNPQNKQKVTLSNVSSIILNQNDPNPFTESTRITYQVPEDVHEAKIIFTNSSGSIINTVFINERGSGELEVYSSDLSKGIYNYTLVCDGEVIATKKMMKQ
jgi:Chaperone of endosialidase